jgi:NADPH:quinone reductase-like Zn-dependent oxidoreductase
MRATVLYGPRDIRFEERETPRIVEPTDAVIRMAVTCVCGSDLWPYRGLQPTDGPTPMGHEYCGVVEEVGRGILVKAVDPGWVRTDMGGPSAPRSVEQGAASVLWGVRLPPGGPTGEVFEDGRAIE